MSWVNLNDVYVNKTGGTISGNLAVNGSLTINDGTGNDSTYNVANEITTLRDSVSQHLSEESIDTGWKNLYGAYHTGEFVSYCRTGNLVEMIWNFPHESRTIWKAGTLPEGFRPRREFHTATFMAGSNGINIDHVSEIEVDTDGSVRFIEGAAIAGAKSLGNAMWITADEAPLS